MWPNVVCDTRVYELLDCVCVVKVCVVVHGLSVCMCLVQLCVWGKYVCRPIVCIGPHVTRLLIIIQFSLQGRPN